MQAAIQPAKAEAQNSTTEQQRAAILERLQKAASEKRDSETAHIV